MKVERRKTAEAEDRASKAIEKHNKLVRLVKENERERLVKENEREKAETMRLQQEVNELEASSGKKRKTATPTAD